MGGIAALRYAATDAALAGVVTVSCPAHWRLPRNIRGVLGVAMTRTGLGRRLAVRLCHVRVASRWTNPAPPLALVPRVRAPYAVVHGTEDRLLAVRDAVELYDAATSPARIDIVAGMGHAFEPMAVDAVRRSVNWALERHRANTPASA
jgi:hypothetical protein